MEPKSTKTLGQLCMKHLPEEALDFMRKEWTREPETIWAAGPTGIHHRLFVQGSVYAKSRKYAVDWLVKEELPKHLQQNLREFAHKIPDSLPQTFTLQTRTDHSERVFQDVGICCSSLEEVTEKLLEYLDQNKLDFAAIEVIWKALLDPTRPQTHWPNETSFCLGQIVKIQVQLLDDFVQSPPQKENTH